MMSKTHVGFVYEVQHIRNGEILSVERTHNLQPLQGINHMIDVAFFNGTKITQWYIGIYSGDYTPVDGDTMSTFPGLATEFTDYSETTREAFTIGAGPASGGQVTNGSSAAEFTLTADATIYGGFLSSVSTKGSTSGILMSAVKFASPKVGSAGDVLRIIAGNVFVSDDE